MVKPENLIPFFLGQFVVGDICLFVCLDSHEKGTGRTAAGEVDKTEHL